MKFKRKLYDALLKWKNESRGHRALLIEGARRVGKSTIAKQFAEKKISKTNTTFHLITIVFIRLELF